MDWIKVMIVEFWVSFGSRAEGTCISQYRSEWIQRIKELRVTFSFKA